MYRWIVVAVVVLAPPAGMAAGLRGLVIDPAGGAVSGVSVILRPERGSVERYQSRTHDDGTFAIENVAAGVYRLDLLGGGWKPETVRDIAVSADEMRQLKEVRLQIGLGGCGHSDRANLVEVRLLKDPAGTGVVSAQVTNAQGKPLAGVAVAPGSGRREGCASVRTDRNGWFQFAVPDRHSISVTVSRSGYFKEVRTSLQSQQGLEYIYSPVRLDRCAAPGCHATRKPVPPPRPGEIFVVCTD